jgi:hypothetical protein
VRIRRHAEVGREILVALEVDLRAVDAEDAASEPQQLLPERRVEAVHRLMEEGSQESGSDLAPRRAERRAGDRLLRGQRDPAGAGFVPERVQQVAVAPAVGVPDHEEQERDETRR